MNALARTLIEKIQNRTARAGVDYRLVASAAPLVVDTRNTIGAIAEAHVFRLGAPHPPATEPAAV